MTPEAMKGRTREFAVRVIRLVDALPDRRSTNAIGNQLVRSATSVGANYRAACRARTHGEFVAKLGIVEEEADESKYWLETLVEAGLMEASQVEDLRREAHEITAIIVASIRTARGKRPRTARESAIGNPPSAINPRSAFRTPRSP